MCEDLFFLGPLERSAKFSHSKSIKELVLAKNRVMDAHRKFGERDRSKAKNVRISCIYETRVVDSPKFITIYERKIANIENCTI